MDATVKINAECGTLTDDNVLRCMTLESIWASMAGESRANGDEADGAEWTCSACGEPLRDPESDGYGLVWTTVDGGLETCRDAVGTSNRHVAVRVPLSWANSVGIEFDEKHDMVRFSISIADPRGAFVFDVYRTEDGRLLMRTPDPADPFPHMPLFALRTGVSEIGA